MSREAPFDALPSEAASPPALAARGSRVSRRSRAVLRSDSTVSPSPDALCGVRNLSPLPWSSHNGSTEVNSTNFRITSAGIVTPDS